MTHRQSYITGQFCCINQKEFKNSRYMVMKYSFNSNVLICVNKFSKLSGQNMNLEREWMLRLVSFSEQ